jgi:hypothetical protein
LLTVDRDSLKVDHGTVGISGGIMTSIIPAKSPVLASRFAGISRNWAVLILALTAALMAVSALWPMTPPTPPSMALAEALAAASNSPATTENVDANPDLTLYRNIIARVAAGEGYYPAIADLHRKGSFPLQPFIVVRLPTLALISATLGMPVVKFGLWVLLLVVVVAWWIKLDGAFASPPRRIIALIMIVFGLIFNAHPEVVVVHEVWAGMLMALSWAVHRSRGGLMRWLPSVVLGLMAVLVRETALPFVLLMGAFALWRRQWLEAVSWGAVVAVFTAAMVMHADQLAAVTSLSDLASAGWNSYGGWPFFVFAMRRMTQLMLLPTWLGAALVPLILLGWASWRSSMGLFGVLLFGGYGLILMVLGRPENFYWALMVAPTFLLGIAFLPDALSALLAAARQTVPVDPIAVMPVRARRPKIADLQAN